MKKTIEEYGKYYSWLKVPSVQKELEKVKEKIEKANKLFFVGNGGSQSVCQHMSEDFLKMANRQSFSLDSTPLLTCLANDYGYEYTYTEWLRRLYSFGDLVIAISSSGQSKNILNAAEFVHKEDLITFTAFEEDNPLSQLGAINIHIPTDSYGVAECTYHTMLHIVLDSILEDAE